MRQPEAVTATEVSDDANEDRWADAFWQTERAAGNAAEATGTHPDELTVERSHMGSVMVRTPDGRAFCAVIRTTRAMDRVELPRTTRRE